MQRTLPGTNAISTSNIFPVASNEKIFFTIPAKSATPIGKRGRNDRQREFSRRNNILGAEASHFGQQRHHRSCGHVAPMALLSGMVGMDECVGFVRNGMAVGLALLHRGGRSTNASHHAGCLTETMSAPAGFQGGGHLDFHLPGLHMHHDRFGECRYFIAVFFGSIICKQDIRFLCRVSCGIYGGATGLSNRRFTIWPASTRFWRIFQWITSDSRLFHVS